MEAQQRLKIEAEERAKKLAAWKAAKKAEEKAAEEAEDAKELEEAKEAEVDVKNILKELVSGLKKPEAKGDASGEPDKALSKEQSTDSASSDGESMKIVASTFEKKITTPAAESPADGEATKQEESSSSSTSTPSASSCDTESPKEAQPSSPWNFVGWKGKKEDNK